MKYIKLFILTILLFCISINCYAKNSIKLYDYADLYNKSEETKLNKKIKSYIKSTGIDPIIITTKDLNGKGISYYTIDFYKEKNFKDNTVLFVIYINDVEPEIYMYSVGDRTTKYYTDERIHQILEYVYDYIENKDYYDATSKYITIIDGFYNMDNDKYYLGEDGKIVKYIPWIEIVILSMALSFIVVMIFIYRIKYNNKVTNTILDEKLGNNISVLTIKDEAISK